MVVDASCASSAAHGSIDQGAAVSPRPHPDSSSQTPRPTNGSRHTIAPRPALREVCIRYQIPLNGKSSDRCVPTDAFLGGRAQISARSDDMGMFRTLVPTGSTNHTPVACWIQQTMLIRPDWSHVRGDTTQGCPTPVHPLRDSVRSPGLIDPRFG